jgi:hypothetical protein
MKRFINYRLGYRHLNWSFRRDWSKKHKMFRFYFFPRLKFFYNKAHFRDGPMRDEYIFEWIWGWTGGTVTFAHVDDFPKEVIYEREN